MYTRTRLEAYLSATLTTRSWRRQSAAWSCCTYQNPRRGLWRRRTAIRGRPVSGPPGAVAVASILSKSYLGGRYHDVARRPRRPRRSDRRPLLLLQSPAVRARLGRLPGRAPGRTVLPA